ncbi:MAG: head GIN domain-containing protein [Candidatus Neomarinimicrobiota bacterium]
MQNTKSGLAVIAIFMLGTIVLADNGVIREERQVSGFNKVSLGGSGTVYLTQGNTESLTVEAHADVLPYIETVVQGNTLSLGMKRGYHSWGSTGPIRYHLTIKDVKRLSISGSGDISSDKIKSENLSLHISGSGDITLKEVNSDIISAQISGSGGCALGGSAVQQEIHISGSGEYKAPDLKCERVDVSISGSGDVKVWAEEELDVSISGSGDVGYFGRPAVYSHSSGSGHTSHLGMR